MYQYHSKLDCSSLSYEKGRASLISDQDDIIANKKPRSDRSWKFNLITEIALLVFPYFNVV